MNTCLAHGPLPPVPPPVAKEKPPTECRDLHETLTEDGTPLIPADHWGLGCPFEDARSNSGPPEEEMR
jgi:hypothetical protein